MFEEFIKNYTSQIASLQLLITLITIIIHVIFAGAVAKDAGSLAKTGQKTMLVSGVTWAFATLIGGVFVAAVFVLAWFILMACYIPEV